MINTILLDVRCRGYRGSDAFLRVSRSSSELHRLLVAVRPSTEVRKCHGVCLLRYLTKRLRRPKRNRTRPSPRLGEQKGVF